MRYAVYFCPAPESHLERFGRDWLSTVSIPGIPEERFRVLLKDVRRYGWHATLGAPFELAQGAEYEELREKVAQIAQSVHPFHLPLHLDRLNGFIALRPSADEAHISALAERCVHDLTTLRAPVSETAWQHRAGSLDERECALFKAFGYPYVLERFRFHMTLSAPATHDEERALRDYLSQKVADASNAHIDALTICCEKEPGAEFENVAVIALGEVHGA
jgi:hypothetical protein